MYYRIVLKYTESENRKKEEIIYMEAENPEEALDKATKLALPKGAEGLPRIASISQVDAQTFQQWKIIEWKKSYIMNNLRL